MHSFELKSLDRPGVGIGFPLGPPRRPRPHNHCQRYPEANIPTLDNSGACPIAESRRLMKHGTQATSSASHRRDPAASIAANPVLAEATLASSAYL